MCAARSSHISNTSSTYYIFLNTSELCSFNLDALRLIKAPTDEATYEFRTTLSGSTCSKFALPSPRDLPKTPAWQTPQQLLMPQSPPPPPPRVQMHQVQPDVLPHVETVEQLVPMVKVLLVEMQTCREENNSSPTRLTFSRTSSEKWTSLTRLPRTQFSQLNKSALLVKNRARLPLHLQPTLQTCHYRCNNHILLLSMYIYIYLFLYRCRITSKSNMSQLDVTNIASTACHHKVWPLRCQRPLWRTSYIVEKLLVSV